MRHPVSTRRQAGEELQQDDLQQPSEKAWGAAAQAVKSVAEQHDWERRSHRDLYAVVRRITSETRQPVVASLFRSANAAHQNCYEGWMSREDVAAAIDDVKSLLALLEPHVANRS